MKFQYNKPSLQKIRRDLAVRLRVLPILKAKETALRLEVRKHQALLEKLKEETALLQKQIAGDLLLWSEYPGLLSIEEIHLSERIVAGIKISIISDIRFRVLKAGLFHQRGWVVKGTDILHDLVRLRLETDLARKNTDILYAARMKATQKVNLYEKVQIPEFAAAIRRIRNFLDDKENLSRASQKIVKQKVRETARV